MSVKRGSALVKTKTKSQVKDALVSSNLSQKMILSVEGQRILSILENCIRQTEILAALPVILRLDRFSCVQDEELIRELKKHQLLDKRLEREAQECFKQESVRDAEARIKARARLKSAIKFSVQDQLRLFQLHPDAITGLRAKHGMEVGENERKLIRLLKRFYSHIKSRFLISVDPEIRGLSQKHVSLSTTLESITLQKEVATTLKKIDAKICEKNNEIANLRRTLKENNTQDSIMPQVTEENCQADVSLSMELASIQQEMDQLNSQLHNFIAENRQTERVFHKQSEEVEIEIKRLLQKFDREVKEKQKVLEMNKNDNEMLEEDLRTLEIPYYLLEAEYNQIQERRQRKEEQKEKETTELQLKTKAAVVAQSWWRGHKTRKALKEHNALTFRRCNCSNLGDKPALTESKTPQRPGLIKPKPKP